MIGPVSLVGYGAAGGLVAGAIAVVLWSHSPWGAETKLDAARIEITRLTAEKKACEDARQNETGAARGDFDGLADRCAQAARGALASGLSIGRIVTRETETNPDGTPRRRIVGAGELRSVLGQEPAAVP